MFVGSERTVAGWMTPTTACRNCAGLGRGKVCPAALRAGPALGLRDHVFREKKNFRGPTGQFVAPSQRDQVSDALEEHRYCEDIEQNRNFFFWSNMLELFIF